MSLDVHLDPPSKCSNCGHEIPGAAEADSLYSANITHNLNAMAGQAGIYKELWRPDEIGVTHARQLIEPLRAGLARLEAEPDRLKAFDDPAGWGTYEQFVPWVRRYLEACEKYPEADVRVRR